MKKWQTMAGYVYPWKAELLEHLISTHVDKNTNCLEIGVLCGKSLMHLVETCTPKHVYAVDPFIEMHRQATTSSTGITIDIDYHSQYSYDRVSKKFKDFDNVTIIKGYSPLYDYDLPEIGYAFIDGNHHKDCVIDDINWVYSLMKNGIIVFDDYDLDGVAEAIDEFIEKHNLSVHVSDNNQLAWVLVN
jgi:hypothetical protein